MGTGFFGDVTPSSMKGRPAKIRSPIVITTPRASCSARPMADHLRPAVCYWHNFAWPGSDMFGAPTFERPWFAETLAAARLKADVAFEMFALLGVPFFRSMIATSFRKARTCVNSRAILRRSPSISPKK